MITANLNFKKSWKLVFMVTIQNTKSVTTTRITDKEEESGQVIWVDSKIWADFFFRYFILWSDQTCFNWTKPTQTANYFIKCKHNNSKTPIKGKKNKAKLLIYYPRLHLMVIDGFWGKSRFKNRGMFHDHTKKIERSNHSYSSSNKSVLLLI